MREVLKALNALIAEGLIKNYAIGGAVGASFYINALQTEDVDAFVILAGTTSLLVSLNPVYAALKAQGGKVEGAHVRFGEWPLQVLTDANPLIVEAIQQALTLNYADVPTRVFRAEHLVAIALQTGRKKDYLRVVTFLDDHAVDLLILAEVIERYGLKVQFERALTEAKHGTSEF